MKIKISDDKQYAIIVESSNLEYTQLREHFTRRVKDYQYTQKFKLKLWDGYDKRHFNNGMIRIGQLSEIQRCCEIYKFPFEIINPESIVKFKLDYNKFEDFCLTFFKDHEYFDGSMWKPFVPETYQILSAYNILVHKYGNVEVATAGGKTLINFMVMSYILSVKPDAKFLYIVPSIQLVTQMYNDFHELNLGVKKENKNPLNLRIDEIMSEQPRKYFGEAPNIYIGTFQSLVNYPDEFFMDKQVVGIDEAHRAKAETLSKTLDKTFGYAKYRFGVSGTFPDKDSNEYLILLRYTGEILNNVSTNTLQNMGVIADCEIRTFIYNHNNEEFQNILLDLKKETSDKKKILELERDYVQKSYARNKEIIRLCSKVTKNTLLMFYTIEYGEYLYNLLRESLTNADVYLIYGNTDAKKRKYIIEQMNKVDEDRPKILIASYGVFSTGISIRAIFNIFLLDSFKSEVIIRQTIGRGLRKHGLKEKLIVIDFVDTFVDYNKHKIKNALLSQYLERRKIYKKQLFKVKEFFFKL